MSTKVWYTNEGFFDPATSEYMVAEVTENEPGYDVHTRWRTLEIAEREARRLNRAAGIPEGDVLGIVASSMSARRKPPAGVPRIEILTAWDPDGGGEMTIYVDGVDVTQHVDAEWVDPGRGYLLSAWREDRAAIEEADYSPAFKAAYLAAHDEAEQSKYIENDLTENR